MLYTSTNKTTRKASLAFRGDLIADFIGLTFYECCFTSWLEEAVAFKLFSCREGSCAIIYNCLSDCISRFEGCSLSLTVDFYTSLCVLVDDIIVKSHFALFFGFFCVRVLEALYIISDVSIATFCYRCSTLKAFSTSYIVVC